MMVMSWFQGQRSKYPYNAQVVCKIDLPWKYEAIAMYDFQTMAQKDLHGECHNVKVEGKKVHMIPQYTTHVPWYIDVPWKYESVSM